MNTIDDTRPLLLVNNSKLRRGIEARLAELAPQQWIGNKLQPQASDCMAVKGCQLSNIQKLPH